MLIIFVFVFFVNFYKQSPNALNLNNNHANKRSTTSPVIKIISTFTITTTTRTYHHYLHRLICYNNRVQESRTGKPKPKPQISYITDEAFSLSNVYTLANNIVNRSTVQIKTGQIDLTVKQYLAVDMRMVKLRPNCGIGSLENELMRRF